MHNGKTIDNTDQFGDVIEGKRSILKAVGKFSNSATVNSNATIFFERTPKYVGFVLHDYNGSRNNYYKHEFEVHIKKNNGEKQLVLIHINSYSTYSGYDNIEWVTVESHLKHFKPEDWSQKRYGKHTARHKEGGSYYSLQKRYDMLYALEQGDIVIIKEGTSTYKFTL